ncbi:MAG: radical SAM protein [Clostridium sp.]
MGFKDIEINEQKENNKLEALEIALTSSCNFNCAYCGGYKNKDSNKLDVEIIKNTISQLDDIKRIKLSGGEVTLYFTECLEIIKFCKEKGIKTQINTNGSLLDENKIDSLAEAGLDYIHFSLNHSDADSHNSYYRKGNQTFEDIIENIKYLCSKSTVEVITETILFEETLSKIDLIYNFVYYLGVRKLQIQTPVQQKEWDKNINDKVISDAIKGLILNKHEDVEIYVTCVSVDKNGEFFKEIADIYNRGKVHFPHCIEGKNQLHLHCNREILICDIGKPIVLGNILEGDLLSTVLNDKADVLSVMNKKCDCTTFL